ncbi:MAG: radical SAM protein [Anaerolineales bacterium]|nr:radical SAM protein [Anaerolineales bacterium]
MPTFVVAPTPYEKLSLLDDATRFEPAGSEPLLEKAAPNAHKPKPMPCISEVTTPAGKKPVLKAMMTTACEKNCYYCAFRAGRTQTQRVTFTPDEMAKTYDTIQRAGLVGGLFLSSGIIKGGSTAQDKIIDTAEILRRKYSYRGYIHLKIMPGAEFEQVRRAMHLADRVSINLEGPTPQRLAALAPKKDFWHEIFPRIQWISQLRRTEHLRASVVTQFVVGAVGDTDLELLQVSEALYQQHQLRRAYYSPFHPVEHTPFENLAATSDARELRLYQASFLLRDYGWNVEDLPFGADANLPNHIDPKLAWAVENLGNAPVEVNCATRTELLRVPGIGPKTADAIVTARRQTRLTELGHLHALGLRDVRRASPYVLLNGRTAPQQSSLF